MTTIKLFLTGARARAEVAGILTSGMSGIKVEIQADKAWDGLEKTLICQSDAGVWAMPVKADESRVSRDTMAYIQWHRNELYLGVEGRSADGELVIPSTMAFCGKIQAAWTEETLAKLPESDRGDGYGPEQEKRMDVQWHQCPEQSRRFVEEVEYDPADYSVSRIGDYAPEAAVLSNHKPGEKMVGDRLFSNEEPRVCTPFVAWDTFGTVRALDQVRWINTPNAPNVRDLGGWPCDGGTVKYGLLFRGGEPAAVDRPVLVEELGIRHDLNLRGGAEAAWNVSPLGEDVHFTKAGNYNWYSLDNREAWKTNLRCVFEAVTHKEPVLFHCAAGADRTGTLACVLEGLLGMSQSDIDKDYELTCFYTGTGEDRQARRRNEGEWRGLIKAINAKSGATFRDKCVTFALELGFTAEQINAYRAAMIDGTPELVSPEIETYTVNNGLTNASTDNGATTAAQYQPYRANIKPAQGCIISDVTVKVAGVDRTNQYWVGTKGTRKYSVTVTLNNCVSNNGQKAVIRGQSYGAVITPTLGYTLSGGAISVKAGGVEMAQQYYSNGVITIPWVDGDIEITVTAVKQAVSYTNQIPLAQALETTEIYNGGLGYKQDARINSSGNAADVASNKTYRLFVTGLLPIKKGDVVRLGNCWIDPDGDETEYPANAGGCNIRILDEAKGTLTGSHWAVFADSGNTKFIDIQKDTAGNVIQFTYNYTGGYLWMTLAGEGESAVVTINEEIG